jgi:predicted DNA-binding protein
MATNPKNKRFSIRLDAETDRRLDAYCKRRGVVKSDVIREGIFALIEKENHMH